MVPVATGTGCIIYYHYMTNLSHFGTEMYLSRAKTVTVCSLSYSWWEGPDVPDVIRPELPAGRSGPVRAFTDVACRTGPDVRSGPVPAGRVRRPVVPYSARRE